jgi:uroporphyrin-III C-methyltransferase
VVFDRLAPVALLADLPATTMLIDASKVPGGRSMPQDQINGHLVEHALAGRRVVRLKGGDAFVFGRGMEEVESCVAAGVPVEVVPGVSSVTGVPALAGISLTQRGITHAFTVVSGHVAPETDPSRVDWGALAKAGATLVLVMAVETMPQIAASLLAAGMDPDVPTVTVQEGGSARQRIVRSTLSRLAADTADVRPPAITVVGEVVGRRVDVVAGLSDVMGPSPVAVTSGFA